MKIEWTKGRGKDRKIIIDSMGLFESTLDPSTPRILIKFNERKLADIFSKYANTQAGKKFT